jgi:protocatechuate 3,4-dioxygenase alpha subunit
MDPSTPLTPSQTIGPFFHEGLEWLVHDRTAGSRRDEHEWIVAGAVTDGNGAGVPDALLEIWQPGRPPSPADTDSIPTDLQRVYTAADGRYTFTIRRPANEPAVAHITLFARGLLAELRTRLYMDDSRERVVTRAELRTVPAGRLATLLPSRVDAGTRTLEWSIRLQGDGETVFFDLR